ncbi:hypothetical protein DN068_20975 [Taibaiella soli]|uniref:ATPase F0F1 n=2 Tax=Taibaiella soli TaxID=1649169 RepID=A0A2W2ABB5_9BACT|nr:hypothetical protein DN068_20975 [Taibaiella soli]
MSDDTKKYTGMMRYAALGTQWLVMLLLAVWGGMKLDKKIGWRFPLLTVLLPLLALVISLWQLIKAFNKPNK